MTGPLLPVPAVAGGAVHRMWWDLAQRLAGRGIEVRLLARTWQGQPAREVIGDVMVRRSGGFDQSRFPMFDLVRDSVYALRSIASIPPADVTIVNDVCLPFLLPLRSAAGVAVATAYRHPKGQFRLYPKSTRFVAPSNSIARAVLSEIGSDKDRVRTIGISFDYEAFDQASQRSHRRNSTILYTGRLHPEKGVHLLLEAAQQLKRRGVPHKVKIQGPWRESEGGGGSAYFRRLRRLASKLDVEFLDANFEPAAIAETMGLATVFCYPSLADHGETFGLAPLEAMACGCLPVLSDLECFGAFANERNSIRFDHRGQDSVNCLADALMLAIDNQEQWEAMTQVGRRTAKKFSHDAITDQWQAALQDWLS